MWDGQMGAGGNSGLTREGGKASAEVAREVVGAEVSWTVWKERDQREYG